jgi:PhzF family phenazine biosynthesis protein
MTEAFNENLPAVGIEIWDAFTDQPFAGNPAGVVLQAAALSDAQMQSIANELHASETAFVVGGEGPLFKVRFFTPSCEVDFCGHATVAVISALCAAGRIDPALPPANLTLAVKAGDLPVEVRALPDKTIEVVMTQAPARFAPFQFRRELLAGCLGIERFQIPEGWPLGLAYTGLWALVVPMASRQSIDAARPDFSSLADFNRRLGVVSTHLYTHVGPNEIYCRDFSPAAGVPEDPVTGSAMGATAALLCKEGSMKLTPPITTIQASQGDFLGRPGRMTIEVHHGPGGGIERVRVAGTAVKVLEGRLRLA